MEFESGLGVVGVVQPIKKNTGKQTAKRQREMVLASPSRFLTSCLMYEPFFCGLEVRQERKGLNKCFRKAQKTLASFSLSLSHGQSTKVSLVSANISLCESLNGLLVQENG